MKDLGERRDLIAHQRSLRGRTCLEFQDTTPFDSCNNYCNKAPYV